jgi:hypothetical protein
LYNPVGWPYAVPLALSVPTTIFGAIALFQQEYMTDQASAGVWFLGREYFQVVVHQVDGLVISVAG